ncbi:MAG: hypothetical protein RJA81_1279, partial [Planctomycetota bacterium]
MTQTRNCLCIAIGFVLLSGQLGCNQETQENPGSAQTQSATSTVTTGTVNVTVTSGNEAGSTETATAKTNPDLCQMPSRPLSLALSKSPSDEKTENAVSSDWKKAPGKPPEGMVWIPPGKFWMGAEDPTMTDTKPVREIELSGFWIDQTEVTNRQYLEFVNATGYKTVAEIAPKAEDYPGADPDLLVPGSVVFTPSEGPIPLDNFLQWWRWQPGADWRHPEGPDSSIENRMDHPVVHIAYNDAEAYA